MQLYGIANNYIKFVLFVCSSFFFTTKKTKNGHAVDYENKHRNLIFIVI